MLTRQENKVRWRQHEDKLWTGHATWGPGRLGGPPVGEVVGVLFRLTGHVVRNQRAAMVAMRRRNEMCGDDEKRDVKGSCSVTGSRSNTEAIGVTLLATHSSF